MLETRMSRHVRLNAEFAIDLSYTPARGLTVEWTPDVPRRPLGKREQAIYRQARDDLLTEVAERTGFSIMVVEVQPVTLTPARAVLPARRPSTTFNFMFRGIGYTAGVGFAYDPETGAIGPAAEVFLDCAKSSSDLTSLARDAAVSISLSLQHGCPLETLAGAITRSEDGSAAGLAGVAVDEILARGLGIGAGL